jgi:protein-tyrosine phosphatase
LAIERGALCNPGPISRHTVEALTGRGIPIPKDCRLPQQACEADFEAADLVIAVKELEHRPLVEARFPRFAGKVRYWHVHDLDMAKPAEATAELEQLVRELVETLRQ